MAFNLKGFFYRHGSHGFPGGVVVSAEDGVAATEAEEAYRGEVEDCEDGALCEGEEGHFGSNCTLGIEWTIPFVDEQPGYLYSSSLWDTWRTDCSPVK